MKRAVLVANILGKNPEFRRNSDGGMPWMEKFPRELSGDTRIGWTISDNASLTFPAYASAAPSVARFISRIMQGTPHRSRKLNRLPTQ